MPRDHADPQVMSFQQISVNQLSFRVAIAGAGKRLILCLHGFPESALSWRYQMSSLAQAGYRVWAPDLRGYGGTSRPLGIDAYRIESLLEDITGLLQAAQVERTILVGHDWGGILAWYYAMRHQRRVEALTIINAPHPACFQREVRRWRQLRRSWYMAFFQLPWLPESILAARQGYVIGKIFDHMIIQRRYVPPDLIQLYRQQACEPGALTAMLNYYRAALRGGGARQQHQIGYPTITAPTLVFWGLQDHALAHHNLDTLPNYVSDLTVETFPTAGHFAHQDEPEHVTRSLLQWLHNKQFS